MMSDLCAGLTGCAVSVQGWLVSVAVLIGLLIAVTAYRRWRGAISSL